MTKESSKPLDLKPVYYIYGAEDYLAEEALNEIKSSSLKGGFESMNYHAYDGKSASPEDVISVASTFPAFSERRVVVLKNAESIKAAQEKEYYEYIKNPSPFACLVFMSGTAKIDKSADFFRLLDKKGYLKACGRLHERDLLLWIKKEAKGQGKEITDTVARKLLLIAGDRLREVKGELDKIILFAGEKRTVDDSDVEEAGLDCREETIFNLSDAIGSKDLKRALKVFGKVSGEEPVKVLGAISRQIRILLKLKALIKKGVIGPRLAGAVGVPPFHLEGYVKRSRCFTERELKNAILTLKAADTDLKTGRMPGKFILSRLIMNLCGS